MTTLILILVLNVAISWFNAWACGKAWNEGRQQGGLAHFMNWMGAIMSACGFTWVILICLGFIGTKIPIESQTASHPAVYLFSANMFQAALELGYVALIIPILGSGLAITMNSWFYFFKRPSFLGGAKVAYNTYAMYHNTSQAIHLLPSIFRHLGGFFGGSSSDGESDDDSGGGGLVAIIFVIGLVLCSLVMGILLTRYIVLRTARNS